MKILNFYSMRHGLNIIEIKPYTNGVTGKSDPMFVFQNKYNKSFVHASSVSNSRLLLDDGTETSVAEYCREKLRVEYA